jgi:hypothetical protein
MKTAVLLSSVTLQWSLMGENVHWIIGTIAQPFKVGVSNCHRDSNCTFKVIFWNRHWD